jgi:hypothetical protein
VEAVTSESLLGCPIDSLFWRVPGQADKEEGGKGAREEREREREGERERGRVGGELGGRATF